MLVWPLVIISALTGQLLHTFCNDHLEKCSYFLTGGGGGIWGVRGGVHKTLYTIEPPAHEFPVST